MDVTRREALTGAVATLTLAQTAIDMCLAAEPGLRRDNHVTFTICWVGSEARFGPQFEINYTRSSPKLGDILGIRIYSDENLTAVISEDTVTIDRNKLISGQLTFARLMSLSAGSYWAKAWLTRNGDIFESNTTKKALF